MIWNGNCAVDGCTREAVDAAGWCKKHLSDDETSDLDPDTSEHDRWYRYKAECRSTGREPMTWGRWLAAGMPLREADQ